jgi:DNA ligase D-like protein (predicted polymerase)
MARANEFGEPVEFDIDSPDGGRSVRITSPNKVMFPESGVTKLDLAEYYVSVGEALMRWIHDRPVLLERYPEGVGGESFYQKRIPDSAPEWLTTTRVHTVNGTPSRALVIASLGEVLWAVNMGVLGLHVWPYRVADAGRLADTPPATQADWLGSGALVSHPSDELRIDLDPSPGQTFDDIREAAMHVRLYFAELGITSYVKTTGSKGLHIYVRVVDGYDAFQVRAASVSVARELARRHPDLITDEWWKELRDGKVFVDFNQNAPHKNVFGAWGVRARAGAQVSTPIEWDELFDVDPDELTVRTVPGRVAERGDPWAPMDDEPQEIAPLVEMFAEDLASGIPDAPWPPVYPKMPNEAPRVAPSRAKKT